MGFRTSSFFLLLGLTGLSAHGEISVTISRPELVNIGGVLSDLVSQQEINALVSEPLGFYETEIEDQLRGALGKPGLYQGLSDAATLPTLVFSRPAWESRRASLVLGIGAGIQSDSFDPAVWGDRLKTLRPDLDYRFGAALQPLTAAATWSLVPGEWSWSIGAFGSWSQVSYVPVVLVASAAGASTHLGYHPAAVWGPFSWDGITLSLGGGWARNRFDTEVSVTLPVREVPLNLTYVSNAGTVAVTASPHFQISLDNQGTFWPVQASTEVSLGKTIRLGAAAGLVWSRAISVLSLRGRNPVHVATIPVQGQQPVYEQFLGDTAWVDVEGTEVGEVGPWWQPFLSLTPSWSVGAFRFGLPLTYRWAGGVTGTLAWGLSL